MGTACADTSRPCAEVGGTDFGTKQTSFGYSCTALPKHPKTPAMQDRESKQPFPFAGANPQGSLGSIGESAAATVGDGGAGGIAELSDNVGRGTTRPSVPMIRPE